MRQRREMRLMRGIVMRGACWPCRASYRDGIRRHYELLCAILKHAHFAALLQFDIEMDRSDRDLSLAKYAATHSRQYIRLRR